ncbi:MAG: TauD/TfdA family dioxygenase [Azospirillaceae bacterium]
MSIELRDLSEFTGSEVTGVDLGKPLRDEDKNRLNRALDERGILVFHGQQLDPASFGAAVENFGELMEQQAKQFCLPDNPIIGYISNRDTDSASGKVIVRGEQYHTDHSNYLRPPRATSLYGVDIPTHGGDTQFVNVQAAYDALPDAMKRRIDGLKCLHIRESSRSPRKLATPPPGTVSQEAWQPIVTVDSISGRRGLYLNTARMEHIEGMDDDAAHALIAELMAHATDPKFEYRHKWTKGDMIIWNNRTVLHQANGDVPTDERRYLYRAMVVGEPLQGVRKAAA